MARYSMGAVDLGTITRVLDGRSFLVAIGQQMEATNTGIKIRPRISDCHPYCEGERVLVGYFLDNPQMPYIQAPVSDFGVML